MCETATAAYHRHDISDRAWNILAPKLPGGPGKVGRPAQDNRRFINAVFWVLRTGAPWRDLPPGIQLRHRQCHRRRSLARPAAGLRTLEHSLHPLPSLA